MDAQTLMAATGCGAAEANTFAAPLARAMKAWWITDPSDRSMFLAQIAHESAMFTRLEENLNYSATRLMAVWPRRFKSVQLATLYAHNPEALANLVYAGRMGNGSEESGDGWRYRGRGVLQITGRSNYEKYSLYSGVPALENPDILLDVDTACDAAGWFWWENGVGSAKSVEAATKIINGGTTGLDDRRELFARASQVDLGGEIV
jgi:putative chitinase